MKLKELQGVETSGSPALKTGTMKVSANSAARLVRYMSRDMYQDKPGSMVREITSNAWDANRRANSKKPVMIKLTEGQFQVRDFGAGMSEDVVENVYMDMGASDKRESDDEIGGFGVGSKTPLAYTDNFTMSTIFEGIKRIYTLTLTNFMPGYSLMYEGPAEEGEVGTEITVNIHNGDKFKLEQAVKNQLLYFDNIFVEGVEEWNNGYELVQGDNFIANKEYPPERLQICLGQVAYPFPSTYASEFLNDRNINSDIFYWPLALKLNVGELEVVASREVLELNDETKEVLFTALDKLVEEVININSKIEDTETSIIQMIRREVSYKDLDIGGITVDISCLGGVQYKFRENKNFPGFNVAIKSALETVYELRSFQQGERKSVMFEHGGFSSRGMNWSDKLYNRYLLSCDEIDWAKVFRPSYNRGMILKAGESYNKRTAGFVVHKTGRDHYYFNEKASVSIEGKNPKYDPKSLQNTALVKAGAIETKQYVSEAVNQDWVDLLHKEVRELSDEFSDVKVDSDYTLSKTPSGRIKLHLFHAGEYAGRQAFMEDFTGNNHNAYNKTFVLLPFTQKVLATELSAELGINVALVKADALEESLKFHRFMSLSNFLRSKKFIKLATVAYIYLKYKRDGVNFDDHLWNYQDYVNNPMIKGSPLQSFLGSTITRVPKSDNMIGIIEYIEDAAPNFFDSSIIAAVERARVLQNNKDFENLLQLKDSRFMAKCCIKFKIKEVLRWALKYR